MLSNIIIQYFSGYYSNDEPSVAIEKYINDAKTIINTHIRRGRRVSSIDSNQLYVRKYDCPKLTFSYTIKFFYFRSLVFYQSPRLRFIMEQYLVPLILKRLAGKAIRNKLIIQQNFKICKVNDCLNN